MSDTLPTPAALEVAIDWATGPDVAHYACSCGFETVDWPAMLTHLRAHGARAVRVDPLDSRDS